MPCTPFNQLREASAARDGLKRRIFQRRRKNLCFSLRRCMILLTVFKSCKHACAAVHAPGALKKRDSCQEWCLK